MTADLATATIGAEASAIAIFKVNILLELYAKCKYIKIEGQLKRSQEKSKIKKLLNGGHKEDGNFFCIENLKSKQKC